MARSKRRQAYLLVGLLVIGAGLTACGRSPQPGAIQPPAEGVPISREIPASAVPLRVFAAASLTEALTTLGKAFEEASAGVPLSFEFGGTQALRKRVEEGDQCDLLASADAKHLRILHRQGWAQEPQIFVHNRLCVILPRDNPGGLEEFAHLARNGVRLAVAVDGVPIGDYTEKVLDRMTAAGELGDSSTPDVLANAIAKETSVKDVVARIRQGEAEAGIVYVSEVIPQPPPEVQVWEIPAPLNVRADYFIAVMEQSRHPGAAQQFIDFLLSDAGQAGLAEYGFLPLKEASINHDSIFP